MFKVRFNITLDSYDVLVTSDIIKPSLVGIVDLQGNQNPDYNKKDFANGVGEISCYPVLLKEFLADFSEEF
ncbi:hypothetical protein [Cognataquiflexum rubidum]|uniref:hypothetical protein n=1 Tax=Cognataquiflexum rubidum TaxID=2922273 RepID=UPI001F1414F3|nr:hypothetical protein [Cognataquiflexum rubidum]MCH6235738.1 hypothetical protein [Cognataquiflexum rubidum]